MLLLIVLPRQGEGPDGTAIDTSSTVCQRAIDQNRPVKKVPANPAQTA